HNRVVLTQMMALDAVAPSASVRGRAEYREIIEFRIADLAAIVLHHLENVFQTHDRHGLDVSRLAQSGCKKSAGEVLLKGSHPAQRHTLAISWDEMPIQALVNIEGEGRFGSLLGIKRRQKSDSTLGHERCRTNAMRMDLVSVDIVGAEHAHANERGGR